MLGLIFVFVVGVYLLMQLVFVPWLAYYMGRKGGLGRRGAVLCAVLGFLVFAAPVWHKELPAIIVYNVLKKDCGTVIHKPFEQWVQENPGVLETLESDYKRFSDTFKKMGDSYPNRDIFLDGKKFIIMDEARSRGEQRIIWYTNWTTPVPGVKQNTDILYDLEKKEVLAEATKIVYGPPFGFDPLGPSKYSGPFLGPDGISFGVYTDFFFQHNKQKEK